MSPNHSWRDWAGWPSTLPAPVRKRSRLSRLKKFDAIISDYQMPMMDGISLLKKVRERDKDIPFILFTGKGREEIVIEALNAGADFYLQKGGDPKAQFAELSHKVRRAVEQRKAESTSCESIERARILSEATFEGIMIHDNGVILDANQQFADIFGFNDANELIGKNGLEMLTPDSRANIEKRLRDGIDSIEEVTGRRANGELFHAETQSRGIVLDGRSVRIVSLRDISERKRAEEALRHSEEKYRFLVENAIVSIVVLQDGMVKLVNPIAINVIGHSELELKSSPFLSFVHPEDRAMVLDRYLKRLEREDVPSTYAARLIRKDGSTVWAEVCAVTIEWEGRPATLNFLMDIAERKRAEDALRESEKKYRLLVESANEAILVVQDGMLRLINPKIIEILGFSEQVLKSKHFSAFVHPDDRAMVMGHHIARMRGEAVPDRYAFRLQAMDGSTKWAEINAIMIDWEGRPATLNFLTDITERKKAEELLKGSNSKLHLLTSITRHDILNQLMILRGYLEMANENHDPVSARELRKKALGATKNIELMIEFTKDYQEIGVHEPVWHDVHKMVDAFQPNLSSSILRLENHLGQVEVLADPMMVKVMENIVDNAARHGERARSVSFSSKIDGGALSITCEDDGVGVPTDDKERIFERGYGKHTGLGLYLARDVLNITGITIEENGIPGDGACFKISVPQGRWRFLAEGGN